jgi:hypothetical protein
LNALPAWFFDTMSTITVLSRAAVRQQILAFTISTFTITPGSVVVQLVRNLLGPVKNRFADVARNRRACVRWTIWEEQPKLAFLRPSKLIDDSRATG